MVEVSGGVSMFNDMADNELPCCVKGTTRRMTALPLISKP